MPPRDVKKQFGLIIKTWRGRSGISQEELAWRAGLHRTYLADIERGARNPSLKSIEKLAAALRISFSTLFEPFGDSPAATGSLRPIRPADILLVEDDPQDVELTLQAFHRAHVRNPIRVASDGVEALEYLFGDESAEAVPLKHRPKLILLDLKLPKIDGMEVLRRIKAHEYARTIPVIVLTASRDSSEILESRQLGADVYLVKPVDFDHFRAVVPRLSGYWKLMLPVDQNDSTALHEIAS